MSSTAGPGRTVRPARLIAWLAAVAVLVAVPFYLEAFWLQTGLFAMSAAIGAIGLNLLTGATGQLSLGHALFLAAGAYSYIVFAEDAGLPTPVAAACAVVLAGVIGGLFSPIAGRLKGAYLGIATLALIFVGQHVLHNAGPVTGGSNGRRVPPMELFGLVFDDRPELVLLDVPFGALERLWYLGLVLLAGAAVAMPAAALHTDLRPSAPTTRRVLKLVPSARRSSAEAGPMSSPVTAISMRVTASLAASI